MSNVIKTVSIKIGQKMYGTFYSLPNTFAHALADFVDNAVQSYVDSKTNLRAIDSNYRLRVDIDIDWAPDTNQAQLIVIRDNAGGMDAPHFEKAFMPAERPEDDEGLHEFGMGMKTAALWLGSVYSVRTKSYHEKVERKIIFDQNEVIREELLELPVEQKQIDDQSHYTEVCISQLTDNAPKRHYLSSCIEEIASIYRQFLRKDEIDIYICGNKLSYEEQEVLDTPYVKNPHGESIKWRFNGEVRFMQYKAKYTVGLLRSMSTKYNGIVLLRRGRVIIGATDNQHYDIKELCGSIGSPRYKRFFAEISIEGFDVSFNKNTVNDKENLDALLRLIASELHNKQYDILKQGDDYRENAAIKNATKLIKKHNQTKRPAPVTYFPEEVDERAAEKVKQELTKTTTSEPVEKVGSYIETYNICGQIYNLNVDFVENSENPDAFWTDVSKETEHILTCKINLGHVFFQHFGQPKEDLIAIIKALIMAKFTAKKEGKDDIKDVYELINIYLEKIKV
ncbi:MAG: ATP-binding protein [Bacteroidales bacterium]|nr:ATP-binding protein [Bacteroidales bacterium]